MSMYTASVPVFIRTLQSIDSWLDKAEAFAEERSFEADTLLSARLAPDQFTLVRQIQAACDSAKRGAARLADVEPASHPDTEATFAEIRTRIADTVAFLETITAEHYEGAADRMIRLPFFPEGVGVRGKHYLNEFMLPNFYFHATTAYAILRHNGVTLGKRDFIRSMTFEPM
jgi:hypothetical protein